MFVGPLRTWVVAVTASSRGLSEACPVTWIPDASTSLGDAAADADTEDTVGRASPAARMIVTRNPRMKPTVPVKYVRVRSYPGGRAHQMQPDPAAPATRLRRMRDDVRHVLEMVQPRE